MSTPSPRTNAKPVDRAAHRRRLRLPVEERRVRRHAERRVVAPLVDGLQAVGGRVRQATNEDGVDDAEQGGRASDGERERQHGDGREHRSSAERANRFLEDRSSWSPGDKNVSPVDNILSLWRQARKRGRRARGLPSTPGRVFSRDALRSSRRSPGGRSFLDSRRPRPERAGDPRRTPRRARMVPRREVRDVHPLGRVQPARPGRMGDAEPLDPGRHLRVARVGLQSGEVRRARVGRDSPRPPASGTSRSPRGTTTASRCSRRRRRATTSSIGRRSSATR